MELAVSAPSRPLTVRGDKGRLQRAVANILDNAIKYTEAGGKVALRAEGDGATARISVTDTGAGIHPADLPHIFDRFYRADRSRSSPGSGLGLALARAIIRTHGGDIEAASTPGEGSVFSIVLPLT